MPSTCGTPLTNTLERPRSRTAAGRRGPGSPSPESSHKPPERSIVGPARASYTIRAGVRRRALVLVLASVAALALGGIAFPAGSGGLLPPAPESPNADGIRTVYIFVLCLAVVGFLLVEGALVVFAIRHRRRGRRARRGRPAGRGQQATAGRRRRRGVGRRRRDRGASCSRSCPGSPTPPPPEPPARRGSSSRATSSTGASATRTARLDQPADRPGRHSRAPRGHRARGRREPQLVGAAARRQGRRDPGPHERDLVQGVARAPTPSAAPSSAGSSTR